MKIQPFKRLIKEDFEEKFRPLIEKLGYVLNSFGDDVGNALNNNLSIEDNFNQAKKTVSVLVNASGTPVPTLNIKTGLKTNCYGIEVVKVVNNTLATSYPTGYPFLSFTEVNGVLTINNITNLTAGSKYTLNLILYS